MPTRLRVPASGAPTVSPAFQSYSHALATRIAGVLGDTSALANLAVTPDGADHLIAGDVGVVQLVYPPMAAGVSFATSDTLKYALQAFEANAGNNLFLQLFAAIVSQDGTTVRATIRTKVADGTELATSLTNRTSAHALTSDYTTALGDRLVIELSFTGTPTGAGGVQGHNGTLRLGSSGAGGDLPENDTETGTTLNGWIEFSNTISWLPEGSPPGVVRHHRALQAVAWASRW